MNLPSNLTGVRPAVTWLGTLLLALILLSGCTTNPATGERQFNTLGNNEEISLGTQAEPEFLKQYGGEVPSPKLTAYVRDLGMKLAKSGERPDLPWNFHVVDSAVINAFALPGGKVFVSRGLLAKMNSEAQLAGVLGHECGHVTAQHIGQQMSRAQVVQGLGVVIGVIGSQTNNRYLDVLGVGAAAGGTVYLLKFGREQELQADALGIRYMTRLGYNPIAQRQVMEILQKEAGSGGGPEFLSTHPYPESRVQRINEILAKEYPNAMTSNQYKFNPSEYKSNVLDELARLPPPKHKG